MTKFAPGTTPKNKIPRPVYDKTTHEFCTRCKQVLPHAQFPRNRNAACEARSGLHHWCLSCNYKGSQRYEKPGTLEWRKRRDRQAMYQRRLAVREGKHPAEYLALPIHYSKPRLFAERLLVLGATPDEVTVAAAELPVVERKCS